MKKNDFAADPLVVFKHSKTPAGLYARQKWLDETGKNPWREDFLETVGYLYHGQCGDGSWEHSPMETIRRLFGLHLTVRASDLSIEAALRWLEGQAQAGSMDQDVSPDLELQGLPFRKGRLDVFYKSATVFLSTLFGFEERPQTRQFCRDLTQTLNRFKALAADAASVSNILRALVVQSDPLQQAGVKMIIGWIGDAQQPDGTWGELLPFYQTVNALAHMACPETDRMLAKAFRQLRKTQHPGGDWGDGDSEWNTFLVFHARRNRKML
jgi:hypothetical protein